MKGRGFRVRRAQRTGPLSLTGTVGHGSRAPASCSVICWNNDMACKMDNTLRYLAPLLASALERLDSCETASPMHSRVSFQENRGTRVSIVAHFRGRLKGFFAQIETGLVEFLAGSVSAGPSQASRDGQRRAFSTSFESKIQSRGFRNSAKKERSKIAFQASLI